MISELTSHPLPFDQETINEIWNEHEKDADPPHIDTVHEEYADTIAEHGDWKVFRVGYPFGTGDNVIFWNRGFGEGFAVSDIEGRWHTLVNLFAAIVEHEGDCRDAEYTGSLRQSGSTRQKCGSCGESWTI